MSIVGLATLRHHRRVILATLVYIFIGLSCLSLLSVSLIQSKDEVSRRSGEFFYQLSASLIQVAVCIFTVLVLRYPRNNLLGPMVGAQVGMLYILLVNMVLMTAGSQLHRQFRKETTTESFLFLLQLISAACLLAICITTFLSKRDITEVDWRRCVGEKSDGTEHSFESGRYEPPTV